VSESCKCGALPILSAAKRQTKAGSVRDFLVFDSDDVVMGVLLLIAPPAAVIGWPTGMQHARIPGGTTRLPRTLDPSRAYHFSHIRVEFAANQLTTIVRAWCHSLGVPPVGAHGVDSTGRLACVTFFFTAVESTSTRDRDAREGGIASIIF